MNPPHDPIAKRLFSCVRSAAIGLLLLCVASTTLATSTGQTIDTTPLGLPSLESEHISAPNPDRVALGRRIFMDKRFSADESISCSSCHDPNRAFSDGKARAIGIGGRRATRNAPSLLNVAYQSTLFWDGRSNSLETQARAPLTNRSEHGLRDEQQVLRIVGMDPQYTAEFTRVFAKPTKDIAINDVASALAEYERTLLAGNSPFDRYYYGGDKTAMSDSAIRGLALFRERAKCASCHLIEEHYALFTDQRFHPSITGLGGDVNNALPALTQKVVEAKTKGKRGALDQMIVDDLKIAALGRFNTTLDPVDIGNFKTPSLRNIAVTGPYMHDGSFQTLKQVIETELYVRGAAMNSPIVLTQSEQQDLLAFLMALTSPVLHTKSNTPGEAR